MQKMSKFVLWAVLAMSVVLLVACSNASVLASSSPESSFSQESSGTTETSVPEPAPTPTPEPTPEVTPGGVNPDDYWVSDNEYDLIGFMAACGYHIPDGVKSLPRIFAAFRSNGYDKDHIEISLSYWDVYTSVELCYSELHVYVNDLDGVHTNIEYTLTDDDPTLGVENRVEFTGELAGSGSINKDSLLAYLEVIPQVKQKISDGHCPFNDTIGSKLSHTEWRIGDPSAIQHYSYNSGNSKDFGICY